MASGEKHKFSIHSVDLADAIATQKTFLEIEKTHGTIGALVNCMATWIPRKKAAELQLEDFDKSLRLNFFSAVNATRETLQLREKNKTNPLAIINMGATASIRGGIQTSPFCAAKSALRSYSQSLAKELGPEGIHVAHLIIDGLIDNERTKGLNPDARPENFIDSASLAKSIIHVVEQDKSCWTFEWDVRPYNEKW
ncbi:MAG: SDR family oxidoreductase [Proteobacteria bacterium]|nr:SDR family oxidoreductase [Pseudomonadota bacterium]